MLNIESINENETEILKVSGRLDAKNAKEAADKFCEATSSGNDVVLDFEDLEYIASAGLRALKQARKLASANGGTLVLRNVNDNIMEVFELTGFVALFTFE